MALLFSAKKFVLFSCLVFWLLLLQRLSTDMGAAAHMCHGANTVDVANTVTKLILPFFAV